MSLASFQTLLHNINIKRLNFTVYKRRNQQSSQLIKYSLNQKKYEENKCKLVQSDRKKYEKLGREKTTIREVNALTNFNHYSSLKIL